MAIARKCDRCGTLYELYRYSYCKEPVNGIVLGEHTRNDTYKSILYLDLCEDCMSELVDWLDQGKSTCKEETK